MTTIVIPPAAPTVPTYPALGSATFNQEAFNYGSAMPGITLRQYEIGQAAYQNAVAAQEFAQASSDSAANSQTSSQLALSAANMKGAWASLTGALAVPATVTHLGRFWVLTRNVANVAVEVPGTSTAWQQALGDRDKVVPMTASGVGDCSQGDYFTITISANTTLSFTNIPAGAYACAVEISHVSGNITISGGFWARSEIPDLIVGRRHLLYLQRAQLGPAGWYLSALPNFSA